MAVGDAKTAGATIAPVGAYGGQTPPGHVRLFPAAASNQGRCSDCHSDELLHFHPPWLPLCSGCDLESRVFLRDERCREIVARAESRLARRGLLRCLGGAPDPLRLLL